MKLTLALLFYLTLLLQAQNGIVRSYYANHKIRARLSYVKDVMDAKNIWYYDNGNLKTIKTYRRGKLNGKVTEFYKSGLTKEEYFVVNGIRDGFDRIYWGNGALKELRTYKMGQLIKRISFDNDPLFVPKINDYKGIISIKKKYIPEEAPICNVDICPEPIGGVKAIQDRVIYPEEAKQYGLEGVVSIIATIDINGFATETNVIKSLGLGCDQAAVNAVKKTRFLPGHDKGKIVKSQLTINIEFKIKRDSLVINPADRYDEKNAGNNESKETLSQTKIEDEIDNIITQTEIPNNKSEQIKETVAPTKLENGIVSNNISPPKSEVTRKKNIKDIIQPKTITCNLDICPEPIDGIEKLLRRFKIPQIAYRLKLTGEIVVDVKVDKWGNVLDTKVIKGVGFGVGTAAEVAILYTKFKPGMKNGKPIDSEIRIVFPVKTEVTN